MNKKTTLSLIFLVIVSWCTSFAQSIVNVSPLTGAVDVEIPIYTMTNGQVSVPVSVYYSNSGVRPKDVEGTAGMGWNLNAGGQVSRQVRGLPDDCSGDNANPSNALMGWMNSNNSGAAYSSNYTIQNNGSCSSGNSDIINFANNIPPNSDTEPDLFYINAPGLSFEMVYDRVSAQFHPVKYQDLVISFVQAGGSGSTANNITSFTIVNDKGIKYTFGTAEMTTQQTVQGSGSGVYFATKLNQYLNGITYADQWKLTSITDPNGNIINFSYVNSGARQSKNPVNLYLSGSTTPSPQYTIQQSVTPEVLSIIYCGNVNNPGGISGYMQFNWNAPQQIVQTGQTVISSINGMGRNMQFSYSLVPYQDGGYKRAFLTNFIDYGCGSPINYQFSYQGVNVAQATCLLADSTSNQLDYWGYFSSNASSLVPSIYVNSSTANLPRYAIAATGTPGTSYQYTLTGSNRMVSAADIADGALNLITYTQGGTSAITYEPNDYYDVPSGTIVQGGGIRVKQVVDYDGLNTAHNITRNYSYINPTGIANAGLSSGSPITLPQFAFTTAFSGTASGQSLWTNATAVSQYDLSTDDHTILYAYTKLSQTGAGSTQYNFNNPGTYWNSTAGPVCNGCSAGEWAPTINYAATGHCPNSNGPIANLIYSYPFIPNPNYDFERGLPAQIISYNDAGNEVGESDYTYLRSYAPNSVWGFKSDGGPGVGGTSFYNKYQVFYNTGELTATVTKKIFDAAGANQSRTSNVSYAYNSANHKLMTSQTATNSDNSVITTNYSYVKDYSAAPGSNGYVSALYYMQQQHMNLPVETYQQVTRGSTTLTTQAVLNQYAGYTFTGSSTLYLPGRQLKWVQPSGAAFTPYAVNGSGQTAAFDNKYFVAANFDSYDNTGVLKTADDNNKNLQTAITDYNTNNAVAVFKNAAATEVAFADFDSNLAPGTGTFTISGTGSYSPTGSHNGASAGLYASTQTVTSSSLTKNAIAQNYIFSIWINATTAGSLTLTLTGLSTHPTLSYSTGGWHYYELKIPASTLSSSFTVSFTSSQSISIDDILFYPDVAQVSTASWDPNTHFKTSQTNTNGVSAYYQNDQWGRVLYALDQDKNIVARKTYADATSNATFLTPTIYAPPSVLQNISASFTNTSPDPCSLDNVSYTWDFGDGTTPVTTTTANTVNHTYTATGYKTIKLTATSSLYGTKSSTTIISVGSLQNVKLKYYNYCTTGGKFPAGISSVILSQGSTVRYTFSGSSLMGGVNIIPGTYTIQINATGYQYNSNTNPTGYASVTYNGATSECWNYSGSSYTITDNLSNTPTVTFSIQQVVCSSPPPGNVQ